jgi:hypothetical protein
MPGGHDRYYFVHKYPGRTLVFVNSIDQIRRLTACFKLLDVPILALHANMQQRVGALAHFGSFWLILAHFGSFWLFGFLAHLSCRTTTLTIPL